MIARRLVIFIVVAVSSVVSLNGAEVKLRLRFLDGAAELLGERTQSYPVTIAPEAVADHLIACGDPVCEKSVRLEVE